MSDFDRRQFLKGILSKLVQSVGTVVVACAAVSMAKAKQQPSEEAETPPEDVQVRAERLAATKLQSEEAETAAETNEFLNGAFRNTPFGAFQNTPFGGFRNTPLGNFRNGPGGGFRNTPLGSFVNGGWPNRGWGGFNNGGWPNGGWDPSTGMWRNW